MCEPVTLAIIAGGIAVGGGMQRGAAARSAAYQNAAILEGNATTAEYAAGDATARASLTEGRVRMEGGRVQGKQKAQIASSGVDVQSGSAVDVLSDTAMSTELDAQIARSNGAREAWGYKTQAGQFRRQAQVARDTGDNQQIASILGGISQGASYGVPFLKVA